MYISHIVSVHSSISGMLWHRQCSMCWSSLRTQTPTSDARWVVFLPVSHVSCMTGHTRHHATGHFAWQVIMCDSSSCVTGHYVWQVVLYDRSCFVTGHVLWQAILCDRLSCMTGHLVWQVIINWCLFNQKNSQWHLANVHACWYGNVWNIVKP